MTALVPIDEVMTFDCATHDPDTGSVVDADSVPVFDVFEETTDTPILSAQAMTKRTSKTGNYRGSVTCSAANGFEAGKWYSLVVSATVTGSVSASAVTAKKTFAPFRCAPAESSAGVPKADVSHFGGSAGTFASGIPEVKVASLATGAITAASIAADAITDAKVASDVTIASVTGNVGGNVTGSVGSVATGGITAASIAADAIGASELAADAVTEIAAAVAAQVTTDHGSGSYIRNAEPLDAAGTRTAVGLASANLDTQLAALAAYVDTEVAAIKVKTDNLPSDPADASDIAASFASIAATLSTIAAYIDTEVAAIKTKTDKLTFTSGNDLDVNVQKVNDVALTGVGTSGDPWGPV